MKRKNKFFIHLFTAVLSLAIISNTTVSTFAATAHKDIKSSEEYKKLDAKTQKKVDDILSQLHDDLSELGISFKHKGKHDKFAKLDEETKTKAKKIMEQVMEGKISKEEADKQLKALGVELPKHHDMGDIFANLDEQTKAKAIKIIQNVKSGKITREEAQKQLKALGVEMPMHHGKEKFEKLDEETKTKAKELVEKAQKQLDEIGVKLPAKYNYFIE